MKWFYDLKTRTKLIMGFGLVIMAALAMTITGYTALGSTQTAIKSLNEEGLIGVSKIKEIGTLVMQFRLLHFRALLQTSPEDRSKTLASIEEGAQEINQRMEEYIPTMVLAEDKALFAKIQSAWKSYLESDKAWIAHIEKGELKEAYQYLKEVTSVIANKEIEPAINGSVVFNEKRSADLAKQAIGTAKQAQQHLLVLFTGALALAAFVIWAIVSYLTKTVTMIFDRVKFMSENGVPQLNTAMQGLANYDLTKTVDWQMQVIPNPGRDDLGQLADCVNSLIVNLKDTTHQYGVVQTNLTAIVGEIQVGSQQVNDTSTGLGAATEQTSMASTEIAQGSEKLAGSAQEAAAVMERLHHNVRDVQVASVAQTKALVQADTDLQSATAVAREVAASAQQTTAVAEEGKQKIDRIVAANTRIEQQVSQSTRQVQELDAASSQIVTIVQSIEQIAEQTNLLALNAAIEAARAGEHGRGFAVVAEEVRKLAEGASAATKQIVGLIDNIRLKVSETVKAINETAPLVQASSEMSVEAGESLALIATSAQKVATDAHAVAAQSDKVVSAMNDVRELAEQTANQTLEMASGAEQVSSAIQGVAAITEETAASAEEMSATAQGVSASAIELNSMAENLHRIATQFHTNGEAGPKLRIAA